MAEFLALKYVNFTNLLVLHCVYYYYYYYYYYYNYYYYYYYYCYDSFMLLSHSNIYLNNHYDYTYIATYFIMVVLLKFNTKDNYLYIFKTFSSSNGLIKTRRTIRCSMLFPAPSVNSTKTPYSMSIDSTSNEQ